MRVDQSQVTQSTAAAAAARRQTTATPTPFGASLARASTATAATGVPGQNSAPTSPAPGPAGTVDAKAEAKAEAIAEAQARARAKGLLKTPKGEKYADVARHAYDEITAGPRNGMFINRSGNARDGQAFVRVERQDRVFHIYGSGRNRLVVEVRHRADTDARPTTPVANTPAAMPIATGGATAA